MFYRIIYRNLLADPVSTKQEFTPKRDCNVWACCQNHLNGKSNFYFTKNSDVKSSTLLPLIKENVMPNAIIYTDEFTSYNNLDKHGYIHDIINHANKVYVWSEPTPLDTLYTKIT
ncbi:MAG: transposase [Candidatus Humimicrobiaceae bacterium]